MSSERKMCVFCEIIECEPDKLVFQNENLVIIHDIKPASDFHYLAVTRRHISDATKLSADDKPLLIEMETMLKNQLTKDGVLAENATFGFHWPPFISVKHLHMHGIGPKEKMGFMARWIFKPLNIWYCTPQYVASNLKNENC